VSFVENPLSEEVYKKRSVERQRAVHLCLWGRTPENSETILTTYRRNK